jgi:hypothetical protein
MNTPAEPVDGSITWGTSRTQVVASAISFECPGDYSLQFVLPDENLARDAVQQIRNALAPGPALLPRGRPIQLFTTGNWKGWLEVRPFQPSPNRLVFFRHPGLSPAQIPGTNAIESVVATIPPRHELRVTGRFVVKGVNQPDLFSATLASTPNDPGVYWFTWYALPNPETVDTEIKQDWELRIHDVAGHELHRFQAPKGLNIGWRRRPVGEPVSVRAGKPITQMLFEKPPMAGGLGDRSVTLVFLSMTMQPSVPAAPDQ